ncbi:hypothetical protein QQG74_09785 [Micromonospora sp. FIMYZ51]|uniref:hypothetical protein n=1 Tax=Micromonospora sp. FIMYZ51 TaxID=3051832 RepID=UPI00311F6BB1
MTDAPVALDLLRRQLAALLSQIDTVSLPAPDKLNSRRDDHPGQEWRPAKGWRAFTVEDGESAGMVYLDHACDDLAYRWGVPGDWEALRVEDARRIGLALLAAAARAEELLAGVTRMDAFRRSESPAEDVPVAGEVRELKARRRK